MSRAAWCLLACGCFGAPDEIEEEDFPHVMAKVLCTRIRDCDRAFYDATYFDRSDCRDSKERALEGTADEASDLDCAYSPADAGDAWDEIADMPCEDFVDGKADETLFGIWGDCF